MAHASRLGQHIFDRFISYGESLGHNVLNFNFSAVFLVGFFFSLYTSRGSIGSILMAIAAINFFWVLHSNSQICPTDSPFVAKFFKGLSSDKKVLKPVQKAYPVNCSNFSLPCLREFLFPFYPL